MSYPQDGKDNHEWGTNEKGKMKKERSWEIMRVVNTI
jgi:hypothetical protein